jgi:hypothetical protein
MGESAPGGGVGAAVCRAMFSRGRLAHRPPEVPQGRARSAERCQIRRSACASAGAWSRARAVRSHSRDSCTARSCVPLLSCDKQNSTRRNSWPQTILSMLLNECALLKGSPLHLLHLGADQRARGLPWPAPFRPVSNWPACERQSCALHRSGTRPGARRTANLATFCRAGAALRHFWRPVCQTAAGKHGPAHGRTDAAARRGLAHAFHTRPRRFGTVHCRFSAKSQRLARTQR